MTTASVSSFRIGQDSPNLRRPHGWVFPPNPVTNGILVGMNDSMAMELVSIIRDCCTDESGRPIMEAPNGDLLTFASRLEQNITMKTTRKSADRD